MVIITDAKGNIQAPTIPETVYQGSNLANEIVFLCPLPQSNTVAITFRLPSGDLTEAHIMTPYSDVPSEYNLSGWVYSLTSEITALYGQVQFQIRVYNANQIIATCGGSFTVQKGVAPLPTTPPSSNTFNEILAYLSTLTDMVTSQLMPYDYDEDFEYALGGMTQYDGTIYFSKIANNKGNPLSDTNCWEVLKTNYECTYGTTTFAEITSALNKGLIVYVRTANGTYYCASVVGDNEYQFTNGKIMGDRLYKYIVNTSNEWSGSSVKLQEYALVDSLTAPNPTTSYPNVQVVKNSLDAKQDSLTTAQQNAVNSGITSTLVGQISTNQSNISTINGKIPEQASSSNQLADKNFVNSSIATNTANFIGTFVNVTALNSYAGTVTNNDYANVTNQELDFETTTAMNNYDKTLLTNYDYAWVENGTKYDLYRFDIQTQTWGSRATNISKGDVSLITAYNRYTYNGTTNQWTWNYTVNTSGFTANQWASINSGITASDVTKLNGIESGAEVNDITDVQIGGTSIVSSKIANIITNSTYNASTNKIATMSDLKDEIFYCTYNTTPYADITSALTNGQIPVVKYSDKIYIFTENIGGVYGFIFTDGLGYEVIFVSEEDNTTTWDKTSYLYYENRSNKVTSISSASTNDQYPTAKLLYDQLLLKQNNLPTTSTAGRVLKSTSTAGTTEWGTLSASDVGALSSSTTYVSSVNGSSGAITGIQTTSNLVTTVTSNSTDTQYPSAKCVYDLVGDINTILTQINSGTGV